MTGIDAYCGLMMASNCLQTHLGFSLSSCPRFRSAPMSSSRRALVASTMVNTGSLIMLLQQCTKGWTPLLLPSRRGEKIQSGRATPNASELTKSDTSDQQIDFRHTFLRTRRFPHPLTLGSLFGYQLESCQATPAYTAKLGRAPADVRTQITQQ